jgi:hypothetical protein
MEPEGLAQASSRCCNPAASACREASRPVPRDGSNLEHPAKNGGKKNRIINVLKVRGKGLFSVGKNVNFQGGGEDYRHAPACSAETLEAEAKAQE